MPAIKIYKCCICHKVIDNVDTIRLQKCLYGMGRTSGHYPVRHYDFCKRCYAKFNNWIKKNEVKE